MIEARVEADERDMRNHAARVCSLIYGFRDKRPNLRRIFHDLSGKPKRTSMELRERYADVLAISRERVRKRLGEEGWQKLQKERAEAAQRDMRAHGW